MGDQNQEQPDPGSPGPSGDPEAQRANDTGPADGPVTAGEPAPENEPATAGGAEPDSEPAHEPRERPGFEPRPEPPLHPAFEFLQEGRPGRPEHEIPWPERSAEPPPGFYPWLLLLAVLGVAALVTRQVETSLLIGVAGLFVTAQGADTDPRWRWIHLLVSWIPPITGLFFLSAMASILFRSDFAVATRTMVAALAGLSAALCLVSLASPVADGLARLLFRVESPSHTLRLAARLVLFGLLIAVPTWFALRGELSTVLDEPETLVTASGLASSLLGYVILALASVGWLVRRPLGETLARLGLTRVRWREWLVIAAGVIALWVFNTASEVVQKDVFPALWAADQRFTEALAHAMGPSLMVLLGLSAGIGEEITMRGALQPRLGIVLTSLLFAALHVQYTWYGIASIFVFGVILGVIRQKSSTSAAILVHALYDVLALVAAK